MSSSKALHCQLSFGGCPELPQGAAISMFKDSKICKGWNFQCVTCQFPSVATQSQWKSDLCYLFSFLSFQDVFIFSPFLYDCLKLKVQLHALYLLKHELLKADNSESKMFINHVGSSLNWLRAVTECKSEDITADLSQQRKTQWRCATGKLFNHIQ